MAPELLAFHEAGHAIACMALGLRIIRVTIRPEPDPWGGERLGCCLHAPAGPGPANRKRALIMTMAGPAAEMLRRGSGLNRWEEIPSYGDRREAIIAGPERTAEAIIEARAVVGSRWRAVKAVAAALLDRGELDGPEAERIATEALPAAATMFAG